MNKLKAETSTTFDEDEAQEKAGEPTKGAKKATSKTATSKMASKPTCYIVVQCTTYKYRGFMSPQ